MKNFQQLFKKESQIYDNEFWSQEERPMKTCISHFLSDSVFMSQLLSISMRNSRYLTVHWW